MATASSALSRPSGGGGASPLVREGGTAARRGPHEPSRTRERAAASLPVLLVLPHTAVGRAPAAARPALCCPHRPAAGHSNTAAAALGLLLLPLLLPLLLSALGCCTLRALRGKGRAWWWGHASALMLTRGVLGGWQERGVGCGVGRSWRRRVVLLLCCVALRLHTITAACEWGPPCVPPGGLAGTRTLLLAALLLPVGGAGQVGAETSSSSHHPGGGPPAASPGGAGRADHADASTSGGNDAGVRCRCETERQEGVRPSPMHAAT